MASKAVSRTDYAAVPSDELYASQTKKIVSSEFVRFQEESEKNWEPLPQTLVCTLLYFLLVEQNSPSFDIFATLKAIIIIGLPSFITYCLQFLVLWWVRSEANLLTDDNEDTLFDENLCKNDPSLLVAILGVFWYVMVPRFSGLLQEFDIVLFSKRVAYTHDNAFVHITNVLATPTKRLFIFVFVNTIEAFFIAFTSYVLVGYLLSSSGVSGLLQNAVCSFLVLQIGLIARKYLHSEDIITHIDGMKFETSVARTKKEDVDKSLSGKIRAPKWATYRTFAAIEKAVFILAISAVCSYGAQFLYCGENSSLAS